jgi:hypothetical protein
MRLAYTLGLIGVCCLPNAVAAQSADGEEAGTTDPIIVTGDPEPPSKEEVYDQARQLSRVGRFRLDEESLPRFETPVCPGIYGLRTEAAELMIDRLRDNATRLEIPLAKENCSPNLLVAFVDDGRGFLADLQRKQPERFCLLALSERTELLEEEGPVRVWNNVETRTGAGAPVPRRRCREQVPSRSGGPGRMFLPSRRDIVATLVMFDRDAVEGMTITQLADYATMRGLSHTRPASGDVPMATILSLFEQDAAAPHELTTFDIGFLRSLYWWRPDVSAANKLLGIRRWMEEAEEAEPDSF